MKRLRRIIFNGLTVLSLLLCVTMAVLWVRSYRTPDIFEHLRVTKAMLNGKIEESKSFFRLASFGGRVLLNVRQGHGPQDNFGYIGLPPNTINPKDFIDNWKWHHDSEMINRYVATAWQEAGMFFTHNDMRNYTWDHFQIDFDAGLPYWLLTIVAGLLPIFWLVRIRRTRITAEGSCLICGYDLRATPDRCPECGTVPKMVKT